MEIKCQNYVFLCCQTNDMWSEWRAVWRCINAWMNGRRSDAEFKTSTLWICKSLKARAPAPSGCASWSEETAWARALWFVVTLWLRVRSKNTACMVCYHFWMKSPFLMSEVAGPGTHDISPPVPMGLTLRKAKRLGCSSGWLCAGGSVH